MNWLPSLLNPWPAVIAASAATPLLVLLYFLKLRRREQAVASTLLWKKAIQDMQVNAPFQRLRRNLLLLIQLLLIALLCLALARPVSKLTPRAGKTNVILIDRSASMNARDPIYGGHSRLDEAKRRAKALVDTMGRGGAAMVIAFDDHAQAVQPFTTDTQALRSAIDSIQPTDRRTKLKEAYQLAQAQAAYFPEQLRPNMIPDVWLFSDGRVEDAAELTIAGDVHFDPIGDLRAVDKNGTVTHESATANVGIVAVSARRNYEHPEQVDVFARLGNFGPEPVDAPVQLSVAAIDPAKPAATLDFELRGAAGTSLVPDRWTDAERRDKVQALGLQPKEGVEFTLDLETAAVLKIEQMHKDGDALAADDVAYVVVPPPKRLSVLEVSDGGDPYVDHVLASLGLQNLKSETPQEYEKSTPAGYDVIVFDRYSPKVLPPAGGNFIFLTAVPPNARLKAATDAAGRPMFDSDASVLDWNRDDPILHGESLSRLFALRALRLQLPLEAQTLVDGTKGPLVVLYRDGRNTNLVVALDLLQSNWPTHPSFPVFFYQAMQTLALSVTSGMTPSYAPGDAPRIARSRFAESGDRTPLAGSLQLERPDGSMAAVPIPTQGDIVLPALDRAGLYHLTPSPPGMAALAVNLVDATEENILPANTAPGNVGTVTAGGQVKGPAQTELWWWLIAAVAMPLLLLEWIIYSRRASS